MGVPLENPRRLRQALAVVAVLAGAVYLAWRWFFTLSLGTLWVGLPLLVAESWALLVVASFVFEAWRLTDRETPDYAGGTSSAVLIPTFNEEPEILRPTVLGALSVRSEPKLEVWVLDDGDRAWVAEMCAELGVRYLARPAPRLHAKAGNLNYALEHITAELLLVVDADHVPLPHALERTVGYFNDPKVAFVQSPQVFFNRGFQHSKHADDPLLNEQSLFYDVICPGKDRNNAAFWCGSSAVLRREALVSVGGVATDTLVEDTHTGMLMHAAGWVSVYHPEVLAVGLAPEDVNSFLVQRGRWARGCYQLLRKRNPLCVPGLSWQQRLHYLSSLLHYVDGPQRLVTLLVPPAVLLTGTLPLSAPAWLYLALFLPQLVLVPTASRAMARGRYRYMDSERFGIVRAVTYTKAAKALFSNKPIAFAVTPKGATKSSAPTVMKAPLLIATVAVSAVVYQTAAQILDLANQLPMFAYVLTSAWALVSALFSGSTALVSARIRHRRQAHRFPASLHATYSTVANTLPLTPATVTDLNSFGLGFRSRELLTIGTRVSVRLPLNSTDVSVSGTIVRAFHTDLANTYGVVFDPTPSAAVRDTIATWCFQHPFGPDISLAPAIETEQPAEREAA